MPEFDLEEHVAAFNAAVSTGDWRPFTDRFADDAVLRFVGPPVGPFVGRAAIAEAYRSSPPDDTIELIGPVTVDADEFVVPYRWTASGATGTMRVIEHGGHIRQLVVTFDAMPTPTFDQVAPVIPVRDLDAALDRYRRLGFNVHGYEGPERYGFADRDSISLHITEWDDHDPKRTGAVVYLYVSDADAVHAEWAAAGVDGRLTEPNDTEYRLREFAYIDPEGTLHRVGAPLPEERSPRTTLS